jgi:uncharacterized protein YdhG (YjbR/CyaY superfamily)
VAANKPAKKATKKVAKKAAKRSTRKATGLTDAERAAVKERSAELKAEARRGTRSGKKADGASDVLAKIAEMPEPDRTMADRIHGIVMASAPDLSPRTWYGMPAYSKDGKVVCFFQAASKFGTRYATLGFNDTAHLDDGAMWPTAFALIELTSDEETRIAALVERAVSGD